MPKTTLIAILALVLSASNAHAGTDDEIIARERAFYDAFIEVDAETMEDIFADDFLYQHGSGQDFNETEFLDFFASQTAVVTRADTPDMVIRDFGETVVTSGSGYVAGQFGTEPFGATLRFVNVWHRQDGVWRLYTRNSQFVE